MSSPASSSPEELIIGTYTERLPHVDGQAEGILSCRYAAGTIGPPRVLARTRNPSFLVLSPDDRRLYAVNETVEFEGQPGGGVSAFARDPRTGDLSLLNTRPSGGVEPAHLELAPGGSFLLVANYRSGSVAVFRLEADGSIGPMTDHVQHEGSSVHPVRQSGPHAHMIMFDPRNGNLLVPDLGLDAILFYELSDEGKLAELPGRRIATAPWCRPPPPRLPPARRAPAGRQRARQHARRAAARGGWLRDHRHRLDACRRDSSGHSQAAAIRMSPSGRTVLVSNRGADSDTIALFRFDPDQGTLRPAGFAPTQGREPRDLIFSPDGRFVIVASQDSDALVVMEFDEDEPRLRYRSSTPVPTPVCLRIV